MAEIINDIKIFLEATSEKYATPKKALIQTLKLLPIWFLIILGYAVITGDLS